MIYNVAEYAIGWLFVIYKIVKMADLFQTVFRWSTEADGHTRTHAHAHTHHTQTHTHTHLHIHTHTFTNTHKHAHTCPYLLNIYAFSFNIESD